MDYVNIWIAYNIMNFADTKHVFRPILPFECKDGFSVSIQGGPGFYSLPNLEELSLMTTTKERTLIRYTHVELGYPNAEEEALMGYAEDPSNPTDTVYPRVPVNIVNGILEKHGVDPLTIIKLKKTERLINAELRRNHEEVR